VPTRVGARRRRRSHELWINTARELAVREGDGVHVVLLWHPAENAVTVSVEDAHLGDRFLIAVAPERALDAFYHPFAYAA
jgi:hypothetical protein